MHVKQVHTRQPLNCPFVPTALPVPTVTVLMARQQRHAPKVSTVQQQLNSVMSTLVLPVLTVPQLVLHRNLILVDALNAPMDTTASSEASKQ